MFIYKYLIFKIYVKSALNMNVLFEDLNLKCFNTKQQLLRQKVCFLFSNLKKNVYFQINKMSLFAK